MSDIAPPPPDLRVVLLGNSCSLESTNLKLQLCQSGLGGLDLVSRFAEIANALDEMGDLFFQRFDTLADGAGPAGAEVVDGAASELRRSKEDVAGRGETPPLPIGHLRARYRMSEKATERGRKI